MKKILHWALFLPLGYFLFALVQVLIFIGLSFFLFWVRDLSIIWTVIISLILTTPMLTLIMFIFGGTAIGVSSLSPTRTAYWLLATIYSIFKFQSVFQYCSVGAIPETATQVIIQLPCWVYGVIFLLQVGVIVLIGIVTLELLQKTKTS